MSAPVPTRQPRLSGQPLLLLHTPFRLQSNRLRQGSLSRPENALGTGCGNQFSVTCPKHRPDSAAEAEALYSVKDRQCWLGSVALVQAAQAAAHASGEAAAPSGFTYCVPAAAVFASTLASAVPGCDS